MIHRQESATNREFRRALARNKRPKITTFDGTWQASDSIDWSSTQMKLTKIQLEYLTGNPKEEK